MLTNKKVLGIFRDYLKEDHWIDVIRTRRGYAVMLWDYKRQNWSEVECCRTPELLMRKLTEMMEEYQKFINRCDGEGEPNRREK